MFYRCVWITFVTTNARGRSRDDSESSDLKFQVANEYLKSDKIETEVFISENFLKTLTPSEKTERDRVWSGSQNNVGYTIESVWS